MKQFVNEPARQVKVAARADVVVAGGGIAGVSSALAAARSGAKVILLEKQCALGGLATLGLIVVYLPLCDGYGRQLIGGIGEELIHLSMRAGIMNCDAGSKYKLESIPECWLDEGGALDERIRHRYRARYEAAPMMLALEKLMLDNGIEIWYDTHLCGAQVEGGRISHVFVENKSGRLAIGADAFVDCSGDADLCHLSGEATFSSDQNRRSAWYYGGDISNKEMLLHPLTDSLSSPFPPGGRFYRGDDGRDVSQYVLDMHEWIFRHSQERNQRMGAKQIPFLIPSMPLLRMTRRLKAVRDITPKDIGVWHDDALGMTGDWRKPELGYCVTFSSLHGSRIENLLAAGRCMGAQDDAWDVFRVIPTCAVTGEAAGFIAAEIAAKQISFEKIDVKHAQRELLKRKVIIDGSLLESPLKA